MIRIVFLIAALFPTSAFTQHTQLSMCRHGQPNTPTKTCIVDGDTLWLNGQNLRLKSFDTPESHSQICGGRKEVELAGRASARLRELLNSNPWTIETFDTDRYGRTLATIRIGRQDVGDLLIAEGLARRWPDGDEWWCRF